MKTTVDTDFVIGELDPFQKDIEARESDSIVARWEFGQILVKQRVGKQLPREIRAEITEHFHLEASEITRRMQLADKFTTPEEVMDAFTRCGKSWRRIIREVLPKNPRKPKETSWEERAKAKLDRLLAEAGGSDERRDALDALLEEALRALGAECAAERR